MSKPRRLIGMSVIVGASLADGCLRFGYDELAAANSELGSSRDSGVAGLGGTTNAGGASGTGGSNGAGGLNSVGTSTSTGFACTSAPMPPSGIIANFSQWPQGSVANGSTWVTSDGLRGKVSLFETTNLPTVTVQAGLLHVVSKLVQSSYSGVAFEFNDCANVSAFSRLAFTLAGAGFGGATLNVQIHTNENMPIDTTLGIGECAYQNASRKWVDCGYCQASGVSLTATSLDFKAFVDNCRPMNHLGLLKVRGVQVQFVCPPGVASGCSVDFTIDGLAFLP